MMIRKRIVDRDEGKISCYSHRTGYVLLSIRCVGRISEETEACQGSIGVSNVLMKFVENGIRCDSSGQNE